MNINTKIKSLLSAFLLTFSVGALAVTLADGPLTTVGASVVKPNVLLIMDNSGSMGWEHMPDDSAMGYGFYGLRSNQCNQIYYTPSITYKTPLNSAGVAKADSLYTAAYSSYTSTITSGVANVISSGAIVDLTKSFRASLPDPYISLVGDTSGEPAYYYSYSGTQLSPTQKLLAISGTTFIEECSLGGTGPTPSAISPVFTKIALKATGSTSAAIVVSGTSNTTVSGIVINGTQQIMSAPSIASTLDSVVANSIATKINACTSSQTGSCTTSGGHGYVATIAGYKKASLTVAGSTSTAVSGILINGIQVMSGVSTSSATSSQVAQNILTKINDCTTAKVGACTVVGGHGYTAVRSGSAINITSTSGSFVTIVATASSGTMTFTPSFSDTVVTVSNIADTTASMIVSIGSGSMTVVPTVTIASVAQLTNFANWYSFHRSRMLTMKTSTGIAFNNLTNAYRVGLSKISQADGTPLVPAAIFNSAQRASWYSAFYNITISGSTPLRDALSNAGRYYAGLLAGVTDPVEYSCQQNFSILTTDGYWNGGSGFKLDGSTLVGNHDTSAPRPMYDGGTSTDTTVTPIVSTEDRRIYTHGKTVTKDYSATYKAVGGACSIIGTLTPPNSITTYSVSPQRPFVTTSTSGSTRRVGALIRASSNPSSTNCKLVSGTGAGQVFACRATSSSGAPSGSATSSVATDSLSNDWYLVSDVTTQNALSECQSFKTIFGGSDSVDRGVCHSYTPASISGKFVTSTPNAKTVTTSGETSVVVNKYTKTQEHRVVIVNGAPFSDTTSAGSWTLTNNVSTVNVAGTDVDSGFSPSGADVTSCTNTASLPAADGFTTTVPGAVGGVAATVDTTVIASTGPTTGTSVTTTAVTSGTGTKDTLADIAMYYYQTDLRTTGALSINNVFTSGLDNNPKQHMTTFSLGLGASGKMLYSSTYLTDVIGDYASVANGAFNPASGAKNCSWHNFNAQCNWPAPSSGDLTTIDDLWHAAVNGRGKYFSAKSPEDVEVGLNDALSGISARIGAAAAAATSNLEPVSGDNYAYVASYVTVDWTGDLQARIIDTGSGAVSSDTNCGALGSGCPWSAQSLLDTKAAASVGTGYTARNIYLGLASGDAGKRVFSATGLTAAEKTAYFNPAALSQYATVNSSAYAADLTSTNLINYLRGDRSKEGTVFRARAHVLGDIINTQPVYVKSPAYNYIDAGYSDYKTTQASRSSVVYVAANDGMVHAFDGATGEEKWAFIPKQTLPKMAQLANSAPASYSLAHQFLVDGPITAADVKFSDGWHTIIVGGLGKGGNEYFCLDVTDPDNMTVLWEYTNTNLGSTFSNASINKLPNGEWAVMFSTGYNAAGNSGLYALDPETGGMKTGFPMSTSVTGPSSMSKISAWVDSPTIDNTAQFVYSGDLDGNLWRFDLNPSATGHSGVAVSSIATLRNAAGTAQQITTKPELALIGNTRVVYVGTGAYLGNPDLSDTRGQSLYAVRDTLSSATWVPRTTDAAKFKVRKFLSVYSDGTPILDTSGAGSRYICSGSGSDVNVGTKKCANESSTGMDWTTDGGWYIDLPDGGERINVDINLTIGTLTFPSNVPSSTACVSGGYGWLNYINFKTGQAFVVNNTAIASQKVANAMIVGMNVIKLKSGAVVAIVTTSDNSHKTLAPSFSTQNFEGRRSMWREIEPY